jgi:hypothetical protein
MFLTGRNFLRHQFSVSRRQEDQLFIRKPVGVIKCYLKSRLVNSRHEDQSFSGALLACLVHSILQCQCTQPTKVTGSSYCGLLMPVSSELRSCISQLLAHNDIVSDSSERE